MLTLSQQWTQPPYLCSSALCFPIVMGRLGKMPRECNVDSKWRKQGSRGRWALVCLQAIQIFTPSAGAEQLSQLLPRRKPDIDDEEEGERPESIEGHIQLKGITFAYPTRPELQIFKGFTLDVPAGSTVALVGESGSGKWVSLRVILPVMHIRPSFLTTSSS